MVQIENSQGSTLIVLHLLVYNSGLCFLFGQFSKTTTKRKPEYLQVKSVCAHAHRHTKLTGQTKKQQFAFNLKLFQFFLQYSENRHRDCYNLFLCY